MVMVGFNLTLIQISFLMLSMKTLSDLPNILEIAQLYLNKKEVLFKLDGFGASKVEDADRVAHTLRGMETTLLLMCQMEVNEYNRLWLLQQLGNIVKQAAEKPPIGEQNVSP